MTIYTSYFYMVRFLNPHEIPLSTAVWDPKWFHDFKGQEHMFFDKRGILNGLRAGMFAPDSTCANLCHGREGCSFTPDACSFLAAYTRQLSKLDFDAFMVHMSQFSMILQAKLKLKRPADFVLMFHEAPDNLCSERVVVQSWFKAHGHEVREWSRER